MKEIDGWIKVKKYIDDEGKPVCGRCVLLPPHKCMRNKWEVLACRWIPGPECLIWHGESKSEWQPIEAAPTDANVLFYIPACKYGIFVHSGTMLRGKPFVIGGQFAFDRGPATHWMPLPALPKEK